MDIAEARRMLLNTRDLAVRGTDGRRLAAAVAAGDLVRVHRGRFTPAQVWETLYPDQRHLLRVVAVADAVRSPDMVITQVSAAALWGLPIPRADLRRVHVAGVTTDGRTRAPDRVRGGVARHDLTIPLAERVVIDGVVCTSLTRTVSDLLRLERRETALAAADGAARIVAAAAAQPVGDAHGEAGAVVAWRAKLVDRTQRIHGARGIKQARELAPLIDARAQLPGESISRLYLADLGFQRPRLQVPVDGPRGSAYVVDFGLDDVGAWGEFDGRIKYTDPAFMSAGNPWGVLAAEKERHDWIHGTTGRRIIRWGADHISTIDHFAAHLAAHGATPHRGSRTQAILANPVGNRAITDGARVK